MSGGLGGTRSCTKVKHRVTIVLYLKVFMPQVKVLLLLLVLRGTILVSLYWYCPSSHVLTKSNNRPTATAIMINLKMAQLLKNHNEKSFGMRREI